MVDLKVVDVEKDDETQMVLGHAGFIKTAEDLYEAMVSSTPGVKFGLAFAEASGKRLVRTEGNDEPLERLAAKNLLAIGAGHSFIILFKNAFPINVARRVRDVDEVSGIYCATANRVRVVVAAEGDSSSVLGVMDGQDPLSVEGEQDRAERREFIRKIGYKK